MKNIVEKLQEKRNIEVAKSILESNGYEVTKNSEALTRGFDSLEAVESRLSKLEGKNSPRANMERICLTTAIELLGGNIDLSRAEGILDAAKSEIFELLQAKVKEYAKVRTGANKLRSLVRKSGVRYKSGDPFNSKAFFLCIKDDIKGRDSWGYFEDKAKEVLANLSEEDQKACYDMVNLILEGDKNKNELADAAYDIYQEKVAPMLAILGRARYSDGGAPFGRFRALDPSESLLALQKAVGLKGDGLQNVAHYD